MASWHQTRSCAGLTVYSSSTVPYCAHYLYEGGSLGLGCAQIRGYTSTVYLSTLTGYSSLTTPLPNSTTTQTAAPTSSSASASPSSGGGLSTGATAGIAVGATLAGVGLLILAWFLVKRRKNSTTEPTSEIPSDFDRTETSQINNRTSHYSELAAKSPLTPQTPHFPAQPSPAFVGPPQYSQHYDGVPAEMVSIIQWIVISSD